MSQQKLLPMEKPFRRTHRAVVYIKDIIRITGRSKSSARNLYRAILRSFEKQPGQFITFNEFSVYTGIDEELIQQFLRG